MDHGPIGEENEDPMDVDAPPSPAAAEPSPDATRPSPMDSDDSDDNDITLDQMLSLIHISSPRDQRGSRMPSSA